jgi:hypothetical protein
MLLQYYSIRHHRQQINHIKGASDLNVLIKTIIPGGNFLDPKELFHDYYGAMRHSILSHQVVSPRPVAMETDVSHGLMIPMNE